MKNYAKTLVDAFYNPRAYRDAIIQRQGFGGRYLMWLALVVSILLMVSLYLSLQNYSRNALPYLLNQVPPMTLVNGILTVEGPQPAVILSKDKKFKATIDTNKTETELRATKSQIGVGKDFLFVQSPDNYRSIYFKDMQKKKYRLNKETLLELWEQNLPIVYFVAAPLLWVGKVGNLLVKCLLVAALSYVVTAFMREEYIFLTRMRLAALALTAPEIISIVLNIGLGHETAGWFVLLSACLYIYVMIVLIRRLPPAEAEPAEAPVL